MSRIRSFVVSGEFQFVGFLGGLVGFFPFGGGGEFGGRGGLAFFEEAVGAEDDAVGIPEPDETESADGLEFEEAVAEGVDLLFVLGSPCSQEWSRSLVSLAYSSGWTFAVLVRKSSAGQWEPSARR